MLTALHSAPDQTLTATQLAAAAGYDSYASANEKFGKLARMIAEDLDFQPPRRADGSPLWTATLATEADTGAPTSDGQWRWKMRLEVAECMRLLGKGKLAR